MSDQKTTDKAAWIRPLPEQLVNKIAAGEVVERPAAIVKELVENSIDAGATLIDIRVEKAGAKSIKIIDNGCGISADQVEVAFSRHATSKIFKYTDLDSLSTYGFRGEALPSIASVARLTATTRTRDSEHGIELIVEGGVKQSLKPTAAADGTVIEVANLFFNTPARRKFLKAETTESRHISRTATALALGRPDIGFSFSANGRTIFKLPAGQTLVERGKVLLGIEKSLLELHPTEGMVRVSGILGTPDTAQVNRYSQYLFINRRYIQSPTLSHALVAGYGELLPKGRFPVGVIMLEVDPSEVDVNVHPTKTEVRLSREREIHDHLMRLVRDALQHKGIVPTFQPESGQAPQAGWTRPSAHTLQTGTDLNRSFETNRQSREFLADLYKGSGNTAEGNVAIPMTVDKSTGEILEEGEAPQVISGLRLVGRFSDLYLLFQYGDDLFIIDQHTAHERVLYEQMLDQMERHAIVAQHMLLPVQIELSPEQLNVWEGVSDELNKNGFSVSHFGGRMVSIEAIPTIVKSRSPEKYLRSVLDDIATLRSGGFDLKKAMAQSMACRAAVMSGDRMTDAEATGLVEALLKCQNKFSCPHGRPTFIKMLRKDLDRQFGRA